ncbi:mitochondrial inner membrane protein required for protein import [Entomophthora muscae]|uniref:Mitochondrial inner membrane protein required for protein import n=1 Tax=Entomophthora muscae TaxID=34485 RepID=A0ACC2UFX2_9FUNG|nr:mitochondrial inner membrane protein required for protein import [Entomophthora muscae]
MMSPCLRGLRLASSLNRFEFKKAPKIFSMPYLTPLLLKRASYSSDKDFKSPLNFDTTSRHSEGEKDVAKPEEEPSKKSSSLLDQIGLSDPAETTNESEIGSSSRKFKKKSRVTPSASEQSGHSTTRYGSIVLLLLAGVGIYNFVSEYSPEELKENSDLSLDDSMDTRAQKRLSAMKNYFFKPKYTALLPPPQVVLGQQAMTLVINLDDTLIKVIWDREHGYRVAKRPGLERFLGLMFQLYEVVIFTSQQEFNARPLLEKLDPYHMYHHFLLTRDSTTRVEGKIVKDLSLLNRDLSQVIMMDNNPEHFSLQPENAILVPAWDGSPDDRYLVDILPFLETLAITSPKDVRVILKKYYGEDIPKALRELELEQQRILADKQNSGLRYLLSWGFSATEGTLPLISIQITRRNLEQAYDQQKDEILRQHKEHFDKVMEEEKKMLSETKMTGWNVILRNFAPPPDSPETSTPTTKSDS